MDAFNSVCGHASGGVHIVMAHLLNVNISSHLLVKSIQEWYDNQISPHVHSDILPPVECRQNFNILI